MIDYILLGIIQGITEWLPVSSKAQVIAAGQRLGMESSAAFDLAVFMHIGTLLAAIIYFRKDILGLFRKEERYLLRFVAVSLVFTALIGLPLYFFVVKPFLDSADETSGDLVSAAVGILLISTGIIVSKIKIKNRSEKTASKKDAIFAGLFQGLAAMPGLSRSAMTMSALFIRGFDMGSALRLSFIMSIFAIAAADIGLQARGGFDISTGALAGVAASFVVGLATISFMMRIVTKIKMWKFLVGFGALTFLIVLI
jgi:undecaprenyl-diphosphatase